MLTWFIEWTTQLNRTHSLAFAVVTVATMAILGVGIAVVAEWLLVRLAAGRPRAPGHPQPSDH